jgi:8-oxo-dGTP diphosphatase
LKWEFPGGKLNEGETEEECIIREIREELFMDAVICGRLNPVGYDYGHKQIILIPFICDTLDELPVLEEHVDFRWTAVENLVSVDFAEADLLVVSQYLESINKVAVSREKYPEDDQSSAVDNELQKMINNMMSSQEADWFAVSAVDNPAIFRKLLEYSYKPDRKLAFRASWTVSKVFDKNPELIQPHLSGIIERLNSLDNESTQRSFLRILSLSDLNQVSLRHHGILADHCFKALNSGFSAIAIKAYSMEIIYRLALIYPELANELSASISMLQGEGSAGVVARGRMILKKLAEITSNPGSSQP